MGTWNAAIFSDDTACDVRDQYRELLQDGAKDAEATRQTLKQFKKLFADADDGPLAILALAVTQSKLGRLDSKIKKRALAFLDAGGDLARWHEENPKLVPKRRAALLKARQQLVGPQPKPKLLRPPKPIGTDLAAGDVLAFSVNDRYMLVRVVRIHGTRNIQTPFLEVLDYYNARVPEADDISKLKPLRRKHSLVSDSTYFHGLPGMGPNWQALGFSKIAQIPARPGDAAAPWPSNGIAWFALAEVLRCGPSAFEPGKSRRTTAPKRREKHRGKK